MTQETGGCGNSPNDDPFEAGQRPLSDAPTDAAMSAVLAALDELRAAQDALSVTTTPYPRGEYDRAVADLLYEAQATADRIRPRAEQEAVTIRRLARIEAERFIDELCRLRQRMVAIEEAFPRDFPPVRGAQTAASRAADASDEPSSCVDAAEGAGGSGSVNRWELFDRREPEESATPDCEAAEGEAAERGTRGWWTRMRGER